MRVPINDIIAPWRSDLERSGFTYYLVGGAVRDLILGRPLTDLDLVCRDAPTAAARLAESDSLRVVAFGKTPDRRSYRVICRNNPNRYLDIASLRGDAINDDLQARDFTINAMAIKICNDCEPLVIDPLNGPQDLNKRIVRLADPEAFSKDPLRILRAFRLAAELDFSVETATKRSARKLAKALASCPGERVRSELLLILETPRSARWLAEMADAGALAAVLPEVTAMQGCTQNHYHHLDVWHHTLLVIENLERIFNGLAEEFGQSAAMIQAYLDGDQRRALVKLAALLHDVGKPLARDAHPNGRITFYNHDRNGAELVADIARRLRLSVSHSRFVTTLVAEHLHLLFLAQPEVRPATRMRLFRKLGKDTVALLLMGMADVRAIRGPAASDIYRHNFCQWARDTIVNLEKTILPRTRQVPLINGRDLIDMGMPPGPELGAVLTQITTAHDNGQITNRDEALALACKLLKDEAPCK